MDKKTYQTIISHLKRMRDRYYKGSDSYVAYQQAINIVENTVNPVCNTADEKPAQAVLTLHKMINGDDDTTTTYRIEFSGKVRDVLVTLEDSPHVK